MESGLPGSGVGGMVGRRIKGDGEPDVGIEVVDDERGDGLGGLEAGGVNFPSL